MATSRLRLLPKGCTCTRFFASAGHDKKLYLHDMPGIRVNLRNDDLIRWLIRLGL